MTRKDVIDITWVPWSSHGMTRKENCVVRGPGHGMTRKVVCAGAQSINYLGPVVKPRDDKERNAGPRPRDDKK